ncbi:hypothetical protein [Psychromicrobium sp. YIM B11713]|uniref:hypothetical protein n=1 Tax=Psychromicrobium sp. YIM B11713 TaxID=3145233 RepID=UPI00374EE2EB
MGTMSDAAAQSEVEAISRSMELSDEIVLDFVREGIKTVHLRSESLRLGGMIRLDETAVEIWDEAIRHSFKRWLSARSGDAGAANEAVSIASEDSVNQGIKPGFQIHLREDDGVPPRVYVFEAYDSDAPADANSMVVDVLTGDWTMRGFSELLPVDDEERTQ